MTTAIKNFDMSNINGRYVAYRYYGDTSSTFDHNGVVVLASHHDTEKRTVYCGVCVIPKHVCVRHHGNTLEFVPHKYDRRAARAIAVARLNFAVTGTWDAEIDKLVAKHATWAPTRRMPTESEIAERVIQFKVMLQSYSDKLSEEKINAQVELFTTKLCKSGVIDSQSPKVFHRAESAFVVHYAEDAFDGEEVTCEKLDDLILEMLQKQIEECKLPRWISRVLVPDFGDEDGVSDNSILHIISGESEDTGRRTFALGRVDFDSDDSPIGIEFVGPSFPTLGKLGEFVDALVSTYNETMSNELPIIRSEALEDPNDETYEYAHEYDNNSDEDEDEDSEEDSEDSNADGDDEADGVASDDDDDDDDDDVGEVIAEDIEAEDATENPEDDGSLSNPMTKDN